MRTPALLLAAVALGFALGMLAGNRGRADAERQIAGLRDSLAALEAAQARLQTDLAAARADLTQARTPPNRTPAPIASAPEPPRSRPDVQSQDAERDPFWAASGYAGLSSRETEAVTALREEFRTRLHALERSHLQREPGGTDAEQRYRITPFAAEGGQLRRELGDRVIGLFGADRATGVLRVLEREVAPEGFGETERSLTVSVTEDAAHDSFQVKEERGGPGGKSTRMSSSTGGVPSQYRHLFQTAE